MKGAVFAKAKAIQEHVQARRRMAFASRQPEPESTRLHNQVQIEVLNLDAINHEDLPDKIMGRVSELLGYAFVAKPSEAESELGVGEWMPIQREGHWNGKILVQCSAGLDLARLFRAVNGRNICINGLCKTMAVSSPVVDSLAAQVFSAQAAQPAGP